MSYAHEQGVKGSRPRAKSTLDELETCLSGILPMLSERCGGLTKDDVFIDRHRLNGERAWSPAIEHALDTCELVIFLVSPDSADPARFCMTQELPRAVRRPVPIIPILVQATPHWHDRKIPGTDQTLGNLHSGGLPKDMAFDKKPIEQWERAADAWEAVGLALLRAMPAILSAVPTSSGGSSSTGTQRGFKGRPDPLPAELLPFLCDHTNHDAIFREEVAAWVQQPDGQALITVVRGHYTDGPAGFACRLIATRLHPQAQQRFGWPAPEDTRKRLTWPDRVPLVERFPGRHLLVELMGKLDPQLGAQANTCMDAGSLGQLLHQHLTDCKAPQVLMILLPERIGEDSFSAGLGALLQALSHARHDGHHLSKLWIFIVDERPNSNPQPPGLQTPHATRLVWLAPLQKISRNDVEEWHNEHAVQHGADQWLSRQQCVDLFHETAGRSLGQRLKRWLGRAELGLNDWADAVNGKRLAQRDRAR